jgi:hypothetical protein
LKRSIITRSEVSRDFGEEKIYTGKAGIVEPGGSAMYAASLKVEIRTRAGLEKTAG